MTTRGHVINGIVAPEDGVRLGEGVEVTFIAPDPSPTPAEGQTRHSVLDIPTVSRGNIWQPSGSNDGLLVSMIENRRVLSRCHGSVGKP